MPKRPARGSTPVANKGRLACPEGEAIDLANTSNQRSDGSVSSNGSQDDPIKERAIQAIQQKAAELSLEFEHAIRISAKNKAYEVRHGRQILGRLTMDQLAQCEIDHLFLLSRAVWIDVIKPHGDAKWGEWADPIRALQWGLGQLMDSALDEVRLTQRSGVEKPLETLAYQVITSQEEQDLLRKDAAKRAGKSTMWKARSEFTVSGGTASVAGREVVRAYKRWKQGEIGYPSWAGPTGSIPLRASETTLSKEKGEHQERIVLSFSVTAGKTRRSCYVAPKGDAAWNAVRKIISGEYEHGDGRLMWDERKKRWRVSLSYKMPRRASKSSGVGYLAVRRSARDLLSVMSSGGKWWEEARGIGLNIIHLKNQFFKRRQVVRSLLNTQGKGAFGRGKKRRFRLYTHLTDKENRVVDTKLKQLASRIRRCAEDVNAKVVFVEDFSIPWAVPEDSPFLRLLQRMPWHKAENLLRCELEEHGIKLVKVSQAHNASTCPACSKPLEVSSLRNQEYVDCSSCNLLVDRRIVKIWNMFLAAGVDTSNLKDLAQKASYMTREARKWKDDSAVAAE